MKTPNLLQIWFILVVSVIALTGTIRASQGYDITGILAILTILLSFAVYLWRKK